MCRAVSDLSCYIIIIYKTGGGGARTRGSGAKEPDHALLANLLVPYNSHSITMEICSIMHSITYPINECYLLYCNLSAKFIYFFLEYTCFTVVC